MNRIYSFMQLRAGSVITVIFKCPYLCNISKSYTLNIYTYIFFISKWFYFAMLQVQVRFLICVCLNFKLVFILHIQFVLDLFMSVYLTTEKQVDESCAYIFNKSLRDV